MSFRATDSFGIRDVSLVLASARRRRWSTTTPGCVAGSARPEQAHRLNRDERGGLMRVAPTLAAGGKSHNDRSATRLEILKETASDRPGVPARADPRR